MKKLFGNFSLTSIPNIKSFDLALAAVVVGIVGAMVIPLPEWALDLGLALNFIAAFSLFFTALFTKEALKVASFPTLLLLTTIFRLAMNVSSTRLALSSGHAGSIIHAFGEFVVRGDYIVGVVVFAILTLVQFLVVAKGAERVAEVAARFTLDAMPGKQMSIDADLRAGAINQDQARKRRRDLERESQLFGAMDGAMKFVKGDVIAGLVIVFVNLLAGTAVGVIHLGLNFSEALSTYALLAIGDGLVSQLPSLCVALAAGLIVTRVGGENADGSLGEDLASQFFGNWRVLAIVTGLCASLAMLPQMPHLLFAVLAVALGFVTRKAYQKDVKPMATDITPAVQNNEASGNDASKPVPHTYGVMQITLDLADDLSALISTANQKFTKSDLVNMIEQIYVDCGVRIPGPRVRTGAPLSAGQYVISIDEIPCGTGRIQTDRIYAMSAPSELAFLKVSALPATDPSSGKKISMVGREDAARLQAAQVQIKSPAELLKDHLGTTLRRHAAEFVGPQEVQTILDAVELISPALVKEASQKVPLPLMTEVFKNLVREGLSIRNIRLILSALVAPATEGDADALTDGVRLFLARELSFKFAPQGSLFAHLVDPEIEAALRQAGPHAALDPLQAQGLFECTQRIVQGGKAVLLAAPDVRRRLAKLLNVSFPNVSVLTFAELNPDLQVRPIGKLSWSLN